MGKIARVVVCGMKGVGKTTLLEQLIYGNITSNTEIHPTIEDIYVANVETDRGTKEKIRFYDTAGLEPSQSYANTQQLARHYLGFADGYVLVYDPTKIESLNVLMSLKNDIDKIKDKKEVIAIVIANKIQANADITETGRTIHKCEIWCKQNKLRCFDVNVMERTTLYEGFVHLSSRLNPPPNKSSFPQLSMGRKNVKTET